MTVRVLLVGLLLVLSGCQAASTSTPTSTPTMTATPTETPVPPPDEAYYPDASFRDCTHRADLTGDNVTVEYYVCERVRLDGEQVAGAAFGPHYNWSFHRIVVSQESVDEGYEAHAILHELGHSVFGFDHDWSSVMNHDPVYANCVLHPKTKRIVEAFDDYFTTVEDDGCETVISEFGKYPWEGLR